MLFSFFLMSILFSVKQETKDTTMKSKKEENIEKNKTDGKGLFLTTIQIYHLFHITVFTSSIPFGGHLHLGVIALASNMTIS